MATSDQAQHYVECDCGKPAEYFCNPCDVQLCELCTTKHLRVKCERGHEIIEYAKRKEKSTICYCQSHIEIECHLHCITCDFPVCYRCVSTEHKQHDLVELQEEIAKIKSLIAEETRRLQSQIRPIYKKNLSRISSSISAAPRYFSSVRDKLTSTKAAWHKEVDDVFREFEKDVDQMEKDQMNFLNKQKYIFEEKLLGLDENVQANTEIQNSNNPTILLKFKSNTKHFDVPGVKEFNNPCFVSGKIYHSELKKNIGSLETLKSFDYSQYQIKVGEMEKCVSRLLQKPPATTVIDDTGFPQDQNNNRLYSIVPLSHDRFWVGGNKRELKLMDFQGRLLDTVTITYDGMYISFTAEGHLIHSDRNDNTIKMISDDNTIQTLISTGEWRPRGITSTTSSDILVCLYKEDRSLSKVVRYNSAGHVMQEIQYDANNQPLYDLPLYITVNKNNDICTTNYNNRTLVVVDEFGTFRFNYNGEKNYDKTRMNALTTDLHGNVLICDYMNNVIHMLDMDGHLIAIIAPKELERPRGICIVDYGKLCVGECLTGKVKLIKYLHE